MKGLKTLNNVQRAKFLVDLFPEITALFIPYLADLADKIKAENPQLQTSTTSNHFPTAIWLGLAEEVSLRIERLDGKLQKNSALYSEQLFSGDCSFFVKHCLFQFLQTPQGQSSHFNLAVKLFFTDEK